MAADRPAAAPRKAGRRAGAAAGPAKEPAVAAASARSASPAQAASSRRGQAAAATAAPAAAPAAAPVVTAPDGPDLAFVARLAPFLRTLRNYTRLQVAGLDHVPEAGPAILAANHTGWLGLDYALTALSVYDGLGRLPRGMAHAAWFKAPATRTFARKAGLFEVTKDAMREQLARGELVMLFPEGEKGAFRPGSDYALEPFARGFVRVAMQAQVPVVPVAVLGGEESNPVGARIESYEALLNIKGGLPIPRNLLPKPVKWRIKFLPPIPFAGCTAADAEDSARVHAVAEDVRTRIQRELRKMKVERGHPYL
jgi:1-acyl-sn-glycerol-3-phosphate acyltransferase